MAHEEISRELAECREMGEFVAYHEGGDDPSIFRVGVVRELSSTRAVFLDVGSRGRFEDGGWAVALRRIHTLDRATACLQRLKVLFDLGPVEAPLRESKKPAKVRVRFEEAARDEAIVRRWTSAHDAPDVRVLSVGEETACVFDAGRPNGRIIVRLKRIARARRGPSEADGLRVHHDWTERGLTDEAN